jgi:hypothetical protein
MSSATSPAPRRQGDPPGRSLVCRLRPKEHLGRQGPVPHMGEVEIANQSSEPVEIEHQMSPLQYLELVVTDPGGRVVSEGHFSDRFSPSLEPSVLRLLPGEKYTATVPLFATLPRERRTAGMYLVRAVYEYAGSRAVSDPLPVELSSA